MNTSLFQEAIEYYKTLVGLPYSDDYPTPTSETINIATKAISLFNELNIHPPKPMITTEGVIGAYWKINDNYVSIDFYVDETFVWGTIVNNVTTTGEWNLNNPIPHNIIEIISIK